MLRKYSYSFLLTTGLALTQVFPTPAQAQTPITAPTRLSQHAAQQRMSDLFAQITTYPDGQDIVRYIQESKVGYAYLSPLKTEDKESLNGGCIAQYDPEDNLLKLNPSSSDPVLKSAIAHEVEHVKQEKENYNAVKNDVNDPTQIVILERAAEAEAIAAQIASGIEVPLELTKTKGMTLGDLVSIHQEALAKGLSPEKARFLVFKAAFSYIANNGYDTQILDDIIQTQQDIINDDHSQRRTKYFKSPWAKLTPEALAKTLRKLGDMKLYSDGRNYLQDVSDDELSKLGWSGMLPQDLGRLEKAQKVFDQLYKEYHPATPGDLPKDRKLKQEANQRPQQRGLENIQPRL